MNYKFLTLCPKCGEEFSVFWVMDPNRVGLDSVARITCAVCGARFGQRKGDLRPVITRGQQYPTGRPVRTVEIVYDCASCGKRGIVVSLAHTDLSWEELSKENTQFAFCDNILCPKSGLQQELKPARIVGALNASWA